MNVGCNYPVNVNLYTAIAQVDCCPASWNELTIFIKMEDLLHYYSNYSNYWGGGCSLFICNIQQLIAPAFTQRTPSTDQLPLISASTPQTSMPSFMLSTPATPALDDSESLLSAPESPTIIPNLGTIGDEIVGEEFIIGRKKSGGEIDVVGTPQVSHQNCIIFSNSRFFFKLSSVKSYFKQMHCRCTHI